jgi:hypothetical protein
MELLHLTMVSCNEGKLLKMTWSDRKFWNPPHYFVSAELVKQASDDVREILDQISTEIRQESLDRPVFHRRWLPRLADAGAVLADQIFTAMDQGAATATQVKRMIDSGQVPIILVSTDGSVHVPWGFIYRGNYVGMDIAAKADVTSMEDFTDFWLGVFKIYVRYSVTDLIHCTGSKRDTFRFLYALNKDLFNGALRLLTEEEKNTCSRLLSEKVGEATTWSDCREKWRSIEGNNSVVYVFGHSNGEDIILEGDQHISTAQFNSLFRKRDGVSDTVCILNGCRTGVGPVSDLFIMVTSGPGFHGFIGTEAEVANNYAASYGIAFMKQLCEDGRTVGEAFESLQRDKFPTSLFYTCYANPEFRVPLPSE